MNLLFRIACIPAVILLLTGGCSAAPQYSPTHKHYGGTMPHKVLVAYASRSGSTMEIADSVGKILAESGYAVDVLPVKEVTSVKEYSAVVLGSAIWGGKLLPEAMTFVKQYKPVLAGKPLAVFVVCLTMKDDTPENRKKVNAYLNPLREEVTPQSIGLFAGKMTSAKLNIFLRFMVKHMIKAPEGDFRDWTKIHAWAKEVGSTFAAEKK
jgi:menaquinone-dependent protoporphyrinogen oxidase